VRADEVRDTGALLGRAVSDVAELARGVHRGVAGRVFGVLGVPARPVQLLHDGICTIAYTATRMGTLIVPAAVGAAAATVHDRAAPSAHDSPGRFILAAVSGLIGDQLADEYPTLAPKLRLRTHDGLLRRIPGNVVDDLGPAATRRIVIFLHGLCGNDWYWQLGAERSFGAAQTTYGSLLRDEQGWTALLRWAPRRGARQTDPVIDSTSVSSAPAGYRFPREFECPLPGRPRRLENGVAGRPPTPTIT
jgi:hypothetical protein